MVDMGVQKQVVMILHELRKKYKEEFKEKHGGYTKEEMKIVNETHKILDKNIMITATKRQERPYQLGKVYCYKQ